METPVGRFPRQKVADMRNPSMHALTFHPYTGDILQLLFRLDVA